MSDRKIYYISGAISKDPGFREKFAKAEAKLRQEKPRAVILNPAALPDGLSYSAYMDIDMAMVRACDLLAVLPDWCESPGALAEVQYAEVLKKEIVGL